MSDQPKGSLPTIDRGRRCQNCRCFDTGLDTLRMYQQSEMASLKAKAKEIIERGGARSVAQGGVDPRWLASQFDLEGNAVREGRHGRCTLGIPEGKFVDMLYFCGDSYQERFRPDGAEKNDEIPEEARARIYGEDA